MALLPKLNRLKASMGGAPTGGNTNQKLAKQSNSDYSWVFASDDLLTQRILDVVAPFTSSTPYVSGSGTDTAYGEVNVEGSKIVCDVNQSVTPIVVNSGSCSVGGNTLTIDTDHSGVIAFLSGYFSFTTSVEQGASAVYAPEFTVKIYSSADALLHSFTTGGLSGVTKSVELANNGSVNTGIWILEDCPVILPATLLSPLPTQLKVAIHYRQPYDLGGGSAGTCRAALAGFQLALRTGK